VESAGINSAHLLAVLASLVLTAACGKKPERKETVSPPVQHLAARLEDEVHDLPSERIEWSTYWRLCWDDYEGARGYELQALTAEGASSKLEHQSEHCFRLEVAKGENFKTQGLMNRDLQLATQSSQLAYRVRAVLAGGRASEWSKPLPVGKPMSETSQ